nr:MAG TPA: hypothetical protein [Caudoviricetes sp.]
MERQALGKATGHESSTTTISPLADCGTDTIFH